MKLWTFTFVLSGFALSGFARANLQIADSFDDPSGTNISGTSSGGWDNWTVFNGQGTVTNGGLSYADAGYSGLIDSGNALYVDAQTSVSTGWGTATWVHSNLSGSNVYYMSVLYKRVDAQSQFSVWFNGGTDPGGAYGAYVSGFYTSTLGELRMNGYDQGNNSYPDWGTGRSIAMGETGLIVVKTSVDTNTGLTTVSAALNPTFGGIDPAWDATQTFARGIGINWMAFVSSGGGGGMTQLVDEVRVGTSFAEVTPVPEPATLAVFAGALGLFSRGRRQK